MGDAEIRRRQARHTVVAVGAMLLALAAWRMTARSQPEGPIPPEPLRGRLQVDLNQAPVEELMLLPGIGPALAERIIAHRRASGPFGSVEELTDVHGIGLGKLRTAEPYLVVGESDSSAAGAPRSDGKRGGTSP